MSVRESARREYRPEKNLLETELGNGWMVIEHFEMQEGRRIVGQLTICPAPPPMSDADGRPVARDGRNPGERPSDGTVPHGGITARLLRTIRVGKHVEDVIEDYRTWIGRAFGEETLQRFDKQVPRVARTRSRRRPKTNRTTDTFYAELARDYVQALKDFGKRPTSALARLRRESLSKVRSQIHLARVNGFLSDTTRGAPGGQLTDRAEKVLAQTR